MTTLEALELAYYTLNEIPNTSIRHGKYKDSYSVAAEAGKVLKSETAKLKKSAVEASLIERRNKDALHIIDGACNPVAVAGCIHRHSWEMLEAGAGTDTIKKDPAIRLMVYQLAHICGVLHLSGRRFNKLFDEIES